MITSQQQPLRTYSTSNSARTSPQPGSTIAAAVAQPTHHHHPSAPIPTAHYCSPSSRSSQMRKERHQTSPSVQQQQKQPLSTNQHPLPPSPNALPHLTPTGSAHMVSVSSKQATTRRAVATATVRFSNPSPAELIASNSVQKGDVLAVARIAGIMAAKKTPDLVPLCHPIQLGSVALEVRLIGLGTTTFGTPGPLLSSSSSSQPQSQTTERCRVSPSSAPAAETTSIPIQSASATASTSRATTPPPPLSPPSSAVSSSDAGIMQNEHQGQESSGGDDAAAVALLPFGGVAVEAEVVCVGPTGVEMEALVAAMAAAASVYDMCKAVDKGMVVEGCRVVLKEGGRSGTWKEDGYVRLAERDREGGGEVSK